MIKTLTKRINELIEIYENKINELESEIKNLKDEISELQGKEEYEHDLGKCVTTCYGTWDGSGTIGCDGTKLIENYHVASHNIPCGTKIFIPDFKGIINDDGIFEVRDTGGMSFDFDMYLSEDKAKHVGRSVHQVYVLSWGSGKLTCSYTYICEYLISANRFDNYIASWERYKQDGQLINFFKFNDEDKDIKSKSWY